MAGTHGVLNTWGKPKCAARNPGSLCYHDTILERKPTVLTLPSPFRTTRDLIFHSLSARDLHCMLLALRGKSLENFQSINSFDQLKQLAQKVQKDYPDTKQVAKLRQDRAWNSEATDKGDGHGL